MEDVELRILKAAIALAAKGGFENVRQRDLAEHAKVALGTLYARFSSKELLLVSALQLESESFEKDLKKTPVVGRTPEQRIAAFFERLTAAFVARPHLGRAILRASASGDQQCTEQLMRYHARLAELGVGVLRGRHGKSRYDQQTALEVVTLLIMIWFANLVGWSGGVAPPEMVVAVMKRSVEIMLHGVATSDPDAV